MKLLCATCMQLHACTLFRWLQNNSTTLQAYSSVAKKVVSCFAIILYVCNMFSYNSIIFLSYWSYTVMVFRSHTIAMFCALFAFNYICAVCFHKLDLLGVSLLTNYTHASRFLSTYTQCVIVKHRHACVRKYSMRGHVESTARGKDDCCICLETPPSAVFFVHTSIGSSLSVILYFLVIWLGVIFSSTQTAVIVGDQDISKCLYNLFLVVERTNRIS